MYRRLNITLSDDVLERADAFARKERYTRSGLITAALDAFTGGEGQATPVAAGEDVTAGETPAAYLAGETAVATEAPLRLASVTPLLRSFFAAREDVVAAWVFGSVARGDARASSDLDVAVLADPSAGDRRARSETRLTLGRLLESGLRVPRVDVVMLADASVVLAHRIVTEGVCVWGEDRLETSESTLLAVSEYWDFHRILDEGRGRLDEWVEADAEG